MSGLSVSNAEDDSTRSRHGCSQKSALPLAAGRELAGPAGRAEPGGAPAGVSLRCAVGGYPCGVCAFLQAPSWCVLVLSVLDHSSFCTT